MAKPYAGIPATIVASGAAQADTILKTLATDLLVVKKRIPGRGKRGLKSTPTDVEFHLNPLGLGCFAVGGALALWLLQLRVGVKDVPYGVWFWPDGTAASKEIPQSLKGNAPTRFVDDGLEPKVEDYADAWAWGVAWTAWKIRCTQGAHWVYTQDHGKPVLRTRSGFMGSGGTEEKTDKDSFVSEGGSFWRSPAGFIVSPISWFFRGGYQD